MILISVTISQLVTTVSHITTVLLTVTSVLGQHNGATLQITLLRVSINMYYAEYFKINKIFLSLDCNILEAHCVELRLINGF